MSTLRTVRAFCNRGWDVTLVLTTGEGILESEIDSRVKVVRLRPRNFGSRFKGASCFIARLRALPDLIGYCAMFVIGMARMLRFKLRRYDVAALLLMGTSSAFVRKIVRARLRVVWIRSDLSRADQAGCVRQSLSKAAREIDHFICVSEVSRRSLLEAVPEAKGKDEVIYNILDVSQMRDLVDAGPPPFEPSSDLVILSVCRLSEASKGLLRMARVCSALKNDGYRFHWYVAGEGKDRARMAEAINALNIGDHMTLLGSLQNPFPAYRASDIVAMLSNYEGLCGVVNEAKVTGKPVIATRVSGIDEQLTDGENGLIVENDEDAIIDGMRRILTDQSLRDRLAAGGYPEVLLNDEKKLDQLEELFGEK